MGPVAGAEHASQIAKDLMWVWKWWMGFVLWVACWAWTAGWTGVELGDMLWEGTVGHIDWAGRMSWVVWHGGGG